MIKVIFKEITEYYDNGCSCCEPLESIEYRLLEVDGAPYKVHNKIADAVGSGNSEQYRCLVDVSYVFSNSSLEYYEYVDWCYSLFNFEQMEDLLLKDNIEVIFLEEE